MSRTRTVTMALAGFALALSASACGSTTTTDATTANEAYCTSSSAILSELGALKDMVASGDSTGNEIADQGQAVVDAAVAARRDSNDLSDSVRADIQAADDEFRQAIRAIPSTTSTAAEAAQAYRDAMGAYNTSIEAARASLDC